MSRKLLGGREFTRDGMIGHTTYCIAGVESGLPDRNAVANRCYGRRQVEGCGDNIDQVVNRNDRKVCV